MKENNSLFLPNVSFIDPDDELTNYALRVFARMVFPKEEKDKGKRKLLLKAYGFNITKSKKPGSHGILDEARSEFSKGILVGASHRELLFLSLRWERKPSIRFLEYAAKKGFYLQELKGGGYPVRSIKPLYSKFGPVKHLWCAYAHMRTLWSEENILFEFPDLVLGFASIFRDWSVDVGLVQKKTELWMPKGWYDIALSPKIEYIHSSDEWESQRRMLESLWFSYTEEKEWMAKKLGQRA